MSEKTEMRIDERVNLKLRQLYRSYGYLPLKMDKFEEYDLYIRNRDFIPTESIIAFPGWDGKLMTFRPDLTLSIVKNYRPEKETTRKVSYSESIYRMERDGDYREILQTGLECLGTIDAQQMKEVVLLACKSLRTISPEFILDISHLGFLQEILADAPAEYRSAIASCISKKSVHELAGMAEQGAISEALMETLRTLIESCGNYRSALQGLKKLKVSPAADACLEELAALCRYLSENRMGRNINIDFSIVNNMNYYSGITFRGYIRGIPAGILSGGRYDGVMERSGKPGGAVGFALYLDRLNMLVKEAREYDVDVILLYEEKDAGDPALAEAAERIRAGGESLLTERVVPAGMTCRRLLKFDGGEVRTIEING